VERLIADVRGFCGEAPPHDDADAAAGRAPASL
jgi:hypothetical protein